MIPLYRWLEGSQHLGEAGSVVAKLAMIHVDRETEYPAMDIAAQLQAARDEGREESFATVEDQLRDVREEGRQMAQLRETKMLEEWELRKAALIVESLARVKTEVLISIGTAVSDVLRPFLEDNVHRRAARELMELLNRSLATGGGEVIEIRAPESMHTALLRMLDAHNLKACVTESEKIEVLTRGGASSFEALTSAWIKMIRGEEP